MPLDTDTAAAPPAAIALLAAGAAAAGLTAAFRGPRRAFWGRMTRMAGLLGGIALAADPPLRRLRPGARDVLMGAGSAAVLYATFGAGDRFARRFVPGADRDIGSVYALRAAERSPQIAARLVGLIAPAEEFIWRGLVQDALAARFGRWRGAALTACLYGGAHVGTGNFTLVGAAGVAGVHWGLLRAAGVGMPALVVSHAAWDVWIFLIHPTTSPAALTA